jgi:hypothetical protein
MVHSKVSSSNFINVFIDGDRSGFNSKMALEKFKFEVKKNPEITVNELMKRFIKSDYRLETINKNDNEIKFKIYQNVTTPNTDKQQVYKTKLKLMQDNRTNSSIHKAKNSDVVPKEILQEYTKLKRNTTMPIPEPIEILKNPSEYKPLISMVLGNTMMRQLPQNHPYVKYFKLLAKELNVTVPLPFPTQDFSNPITSLQNNGIQGNRIQNDADTDSD